MLRRAALAGVLLVSSGCALYNDVSIKPLTLNPGNIERGSDLQSMILKADYLRAIAAGADLDTRTRVQASDLAAVGRACLTAGRLDEARRRLRSALDLERGREAYAQIAWDLSQVEYLANNYELSLEWARLAQERGLNIRQWHLDYISALREIPVYQFSGATTDYLPFRFGRPDVPRVHARLNGHKDVEAVVDSGAVLSIIAEGVAARLGLRRFPGIEGTFQGLLGEPIPVTFGLVERLQLGEIVIENVPVAVMPDEKMRFLVSKKERREITLEFLLGSNLLKEFRFELDFRRGRVRFDRLTPADRVPAVDQNLFFHAFRPHVRGSVNQRAWFMFVLDTGSEITFLNEARLASLPIQMFGKGAHSATLQGLGGAMKRGAKLEDVDIGIDEWSGTFRTLPMYESHDREYAVGIIGQNMLRNFNVVVDFGRMRIDLNRR